MTEHRRNTNRRRTSQRSTGSPDPLVRPAQVESAALKQRARRGYSLAPKRSATRAAQAMPVPGTSAHPALVTRLGFRNVAEQIDDLRLFYLIGCAYHCGARSLRQVARMLRSPAAEDLGGKVGESLPKSLRAIHESVAVLEDLLGQQLVKRTGEGLGYDGLTQDGERLWELTAQFVREFWA